MITKKEKKTMRKNTENFLNKTSYTKEELKSLVNQASEMEKAFNCHNKKIKEMEDFLQKELLEIANNNKNTEKIKKELKGIVKIYNEKKDIEIEVVKETIKTLKEIL